MTLDELKYLSARVQYDFGGDREKGYFYAPRCNLITAADGVRNRELGRDRLLVIVHRPCLPTRSSETLFEACVALVKPERTWPYDKYGYGRTTAPATRRMLE